MCSSHKTLFSSLSSLYWTESTPACYTVYSFSDFARSISLSRPSVLGRLLLTTFLGAHIFTRRTRPSGSANEPTSNRVHFSCSRSGLPTTRPKDVSGALTSWESFGYGQRNPTRSLRSRTKRKSDSDESLSSQKDRIMNTIWSWHVNGHYLFILYFPLQLIQFRNTSARMPLREEN